MPDGCIYREFHRLGQTVFVLAPAMGSLLAISISPGLPLSGWRTWTATVSLLSLPLFYLGHGIYRLNRIVLTPTRLTVGRETFKQSDFGLAFGVQPPLVMSVDEQNQVESDWPLPQNPTIRIAGGSWGRRRLTRMVVLREPDPDSLVAIFTRHPQELDRLLTAWIELPAA